MFVFHFFFTPLPIEVVCILVYLIVLCGDQGDIWNLDDSLNLYNGVYFLSKNLFSQLIGNDSHEF